MTVGLIQCGTISLTAWAPDVHSRAVFAQSPVRRFARWLANDRIDVHALYGPLLPQALAEWGTRVLSLALDTSMLWETYGLVRISLVDRGRAVPLVWIVVDHHSSRVAYEVYKSLLETVAALRPVPCRVVFTADRGCADIHLMHHLTGLGWHWRLRIKGSCWIDRHGQRHGQVNRMPWCPGQALFWQHVSITKQEYGPVHLALGRPIDSKEDWFVVSDEPTAVETCAEYGWRFDIEEHVRDDTSNGLPLESSLIRSAKALERLCGVWALTTLSRVAQGTAVVHQGTRRWVDAHGFRGQSDLQIGGNWVKLALSRGYELLTSRHLSAEADPAPAMASKSQHRKHPPLFSTVEFRDAA